MNWNWKLKLKRWIEIEIELNFNNFFFIKSLKKFLITYRFWFNLNWLTITQLFSKFFLRTYFLCIECPDVSTKYLLKKNSILKIMMIQERLKHVRHSVCLQIINIRQKIRKNAVKAKAKTKPNQKSKAQVLRHTNESNIPFPISLFPFLFSLFSFPFSLFPFPISNFQFLIFNFLNFRYFANISLRYILRTFILLISISYQF